MTDKDQLDIAQQIFQIMKRVQPPRIVRPETGLTRSEIELLMMLTIKLESDKKALAVSKISNMLHVTPAAVTHMLNPLEEKGFIERLPDPGDRRVVLIGLTEKGIEFSKSVMDEVQQKLLGLVNHLGVEDSKTFIRLMSKVTDYVTTIEQN